MKQFAKITPRNVHFVAMAILGIMASVGLASVLFLLGKSGQIVPVEKVRQKSSCPKGDREVLNLEFRATQCGLRKNNNVTTLTPEDIFMGLEKHKDDLTLGEVFIIVSTNASKGAQ